MIELRDIRFRYPAGEFELRVRALHVDNGEQVAVIGSSGSGKTTLLHLVAGIVAADGGSVVTDGRALADLDDAARRAFRIERLGLVFQEFELVDYLSVLDNILLPYRIGPSLHLNGDVRKRARSLAERVGLGRAVERLVTRLSQGEKQRVAVCRALVTEPVLLLADEPTGNLDPANKYRVLDILSDYAAQTGATLLTVTHDHALLDRFSRVVDFASLDGSEAPA